MTASVMEAYADQLVSYDTAKATIRFSAGKPLPDALVRKLVKANRGEREKRQQVRRSEVRCKPVLNEAACAA